MTMWYRVGQCPGRGQFGRHRTSITGPPLGPQDQSTRAPEASATNRDRALNAHAVAHKTIRQPAGRGGTRWYREAAMLLLRQTKVDVRLRDEKGLQRLRAS